MIERQNVQSGILKSWRIVEDLKLAETISNPSPLGVSEEFRDLALDDRTTYVNLYTRGLQLSHYNFSLIDYSYFQFSWSSPNHVRYAYYPNPFTDWSGSGDDSIMSAESWRRELEEEIISHEEYLDLLRGLAPEMRAPVIRYENAPDQYRPFHHPCSHFHFGFHSDNRWPSSRILTPVAFTLLILKNYYGDSWRKLGESEDTPYGNKLESQLVDERVMRCRIIGEDYFSALEQKSFCVG